MVDIYEYLPEGERSRPNAFSVTITGRCMFPEIRPGDRAWVDPDQPPENGRLVVFTLDDEQVMLKRFVVRNGRRWLEPLNGPPIPFDEHVRISGTVFRIIKDV